MILAGTSGADLIEAWSAAFAAVGTVGAFITGGVLLTRQIRRDRRADQREQASHVAAWIEIVDRHDPDIYDETPGEVRMRGTMAAAVVMNASTLPIYNGTVIWVSALSGGELATRGFEMIGPGNRAVFQRPADLTSGERLGVSIRFRDANDVIWERDHLGRLITAESAG